MKCKQARQRLLATSGPRKLSAEVQAHLNRCPRCVRLHARLSEIDRDMARLPVPSSAEAKAAVIEQILCEPAVPQLPWKRRVAGTRWQRALVGLAAGVLVVLGTAIFRAGRHADTTAALPDPLLASLLKHNLTLAKEASPEKTMKTLAALAHDLDGETQQLARVATADDLNALAALYDDVVRKGMLTRADEVPQEERQDVLGRIAADLAETSQAAKQLALEVPPNAVGPLKKIAATAEEANQALRNKIKDPKLAHDDPPSVREGKS